MPPEFFTKVYGKMNLLWVTGSVRLDPEAVNVVKVFLIYQYFTNFLCILLRLSIILTAHFICLVGSI